MALAEIETKNDISFTRLIAEAERKLPIFHHRSEWNVHKPVTAFKPAPSEKKVIFSEEEGKRIQVEAIQELVESSGR